MANTEDAANDDRGAAPSWPAHRPLGWGGAPESSVPPGHTPQPGPSHPSAPEPAAPHPGPPSWSGGQWSHPAGDTAGQWSHPTSDPAGQWPSPPAAGFGSGPGYGGTSPYGERAQPTSGPYYTASPSIGVAAAGRRRVPWAIGLVAVVLVSGAAGAGIALAVDNGGGSLGANAPLPTGASGPTTPGLNVAAIAARVEPATVDITANGPQGEDEGTGMVLTAAGVVLTNNHVIDGSTTLQGQINGSGQTYALSVLGTDATDDIALLQLHGGSHFRTVTVGDSSAVAVGDQVVAIGNALALPGPETVTNGIISATRRSISVSDSATGLNENLKGLFQTSAAINPGNSGGPLVDSAGRVIGMNTAQATSSGSGQGASNVGFAIPINDAMAVARDVYAGKASATVQIGPHAIMGVEVTSVACAEGQDGCAGLGATTTPFGAIPGTTTYRAPTNRGAVVLQVESEAPAQKAGITTGDVIVSINGNSVSSPTVLTTDMNLHRVGERVIIAWLGVNGARHTSSVTLVAGPNV